VCRRNAVRKTTIIGRSRGPAHRTACGATTLSSFGRGANSNDQQQGSEHHEHETRAHKAFQRFTRGGSRTGSSGLGNETADATDAGRRLLAASSVGGQMQVRAVRTTGGEGGENSAAARPSAEVSGAARRLLLTRGRRCRCHYRCCRHRRDCRGCRRRRPCRTDGAGA
jgi:hypothetical protein